jgi:NADPH-dependent 2,4-dienoyl-CoA reductase/sulfur reductase-like enzyme
MEAALTAAQRGHEVIVFEKGNRVGGQVWVGAGSPLRKNWARIAEFYDRQTRKGLFETRLNAEATAEEILSLEPDALVIATGSQPVRLEIAGGPPALTVHEVIAGKADSAKRVLLYDREAFNRPLVAADYLSSRGAHVEFVTPLDYVCDAVEGMMREEMIAQVSDRGVTFTAGEEIVGWEGEGAIRLREMQTGDERILEGIDAVVATVGSVSVSELADQLRGEIAELHVIGDANGPRTVEAATYEGGRIGRLL